MASSLRFVRRFATGSATGILEIGRRSERNVARIARNVGMTAKRRAAIREATTSCYAWRFSVREERREGRQERRDDASSAAIREATTSCYALRFLRRFATGILEIGSRSERNVARIARNVGMTDKSRAATAIRIETAGRCGHKRTAETRGAVVDQRRRLIARA